MKKRIILSVLILIGASVVFGQGFEMPLPVNPNLQKGQHKADDAMDKMSGLIPMRFFNALNRQPISGALVEIPNTGTFTTDRQGKIVFPKIPDGNYTLIFSKEGFITTDIEFRVLLGAVDFNWYNISPGIPDKDYRFVLEWAENPKDLDVNFVKTGGSGGYHLSFRNLQSAEDGNAVLDRDDTNGYGPETVTIGNIDQRASYSLFVLDYTNRSNPRSTQMSKEGAVVRVYSRNRLLHTIRIPSNAAGNRWNVFKIERGVLTIVNTVGIQ